MKFRRPTAKGLMHHIAHSAHVSYFGAAFFEAHGTYGTIAGVLCLLGILNYFLHFE